MTAAEVRSELTNDNMGVLLPHRRHGVFHLSPLQGHRTVAIIYLSQEEYLSDKIAQKCWFGDKLKLAKSLLRKHGLLPEIMYYHVVTPVKRGDWNWKSVYQQRKSPRTR